MTAQVSLDLDFGLVGYHDAKEPFHVRLNAEALFRLIAGARNAWRVYALALIQRPGDLWPYVHVTPVAVPTELAARIRGARAAVHVPLGVRHPWPAGQIPWTAFDRLFQPAGTYDPEPLDDAWRRHRLGSYLPDLFGLVQAALVELRSGDPLAARELRLISEHKHPLDGYSRAEALRRQHDRFYAPRPDNHGDGFYRELARLLGDPALVSVACRGPGDWRLLRLLCTEQCRRADSTGHRPLHALFISMLREFHPSPAGWGAEVLWFSEGLAHGDLLIEDRPSGASVKELIERYGLRSQVVLADEGADEIEGYARFEGDDWVRYERIEATQRRLRIEFISARWPGDQQPVIAFADSGASLYPHEHALVVIGSGVEDSALAVLGDLLADWRQRGRAPLVIVEAGAPAGVAALGAVVELSDMAALAAASEALTAILRDRLPWIDIALLLSPDPAMVSALAASLASQRQPWLPWVAATPEVQGIPIDLVIDADVTTALRQASDYARNARPSRWSRL